MQKMKLLFVICFIVGLCFFAGCKSYKVNPRMQMINNESSVTELLNYVNEKTVYTAKEECYADFAEFSSNTEIFMYNCDYVSKEQSLLGKLTASVAAHQSEYVVLSDKWHYKKVFAYSDNNMYYKFDIDNVPIVLLKKDSLYYVGGENISYTQVDNVETSDILFDAWCNSLSYTGLVLKDTVSRRIVEISGVTYTFEYYKLDEHCDTLYDGYLFDVNGVLCWRYINGQWYTVDACTTEVSADIFTVV